MLEMKMIGYRPHPRRRMRLEPVYSRPETVSVEGRLRFFPWLIRQIDHREEKNMNEILNIADIYRERVEIMKIQRYNVLDCPGMGKNHVYRE